MCGMDVHNISHSSHQDAVCPAFDTPGLSLSAMNPFLIVSSPACNEICRASHTHSEHASSLTAQALNTLQDIAARTDQKSALARNVEQIQTASADYDDDAFVKKKFFETSLPPTYQEASDDFRSLRNLHLSVLRMRTIHGDTADSNPARLASSRRTRLLQRFEELHRTIIAEPRSGKYPSNPPRA